MTEVLYNPKIKPEHLARKAIVYFRQSSGKQVRQNKESQLLQYAVAERVRALGWKQVEIINSDLGSSAGLASAQREGFERVLSLVALGEIGIVGSREVSRLSRTDRDWCRLLEVCQIFGRLRFIPTDGSAKRFNWCSPSFENCGACVRHSNGSVITMWSCRPTPFRERGWCGRFRRRA